MLKDKENELKMAVLKSLIKTMDVGSEETPEEAIVIKEKTAMLPEEGLEEKLLPEEDMEEGLLNEDIPLIDEEVSAEIEEDILGEEEDDEEALLSPKLANLFGKKRNRGY